MSILKPRKGKEGARVASWTNESKTERETLVLDIQR